MTRNETITKIKAALKKRSKKSWSVTGGRGTAYGWITIEAPPKRRTWKYRLPAGMPDIPKNWMGYNSGQPGGTMTPLDCQELANLFDLAEPVHSQGISIPASWDYYQEYVDRAEGRTPMVMGKPYWD